MVLTATVSEVSKYSKHHKETAFFSSADIITSLIICGEEIMKHFAVMVVLVSVVSGCDMLNMLVG